jgi:hypothetical protein
VQHFWICIKNGDRIIGSMCAGVPDLNKPLSPFLNQPNSKLIGTGNLHPSIQPSELSQSAAKCAHAQNRLVRLKYGFSLLGKFNKHTLKCYLHGQEMGGAASYLSVSMYVRTRVRSSFRNPLTLSPYLPGSATPPAALIKIPKE